MSLTSTAVSNSSSPLLASLPQFDRPTYLMCPPEWYDVNYVINPWMAGNLHRPSRDTAFAQWKELHSHLQRIADIRLIHGQPGSPDMVFVAGTPLWSSMASPRSPASPTPNAKPRNRTSVAGSSPTASLSGILLARPHSRVKATHSSTQQAIAFGLPMASAPAVRAIAMSPTHGTPWSPLFTWSTRASTTSTPASLLSPAVICSTSRARSMPPRSPRSEAAYAPEKRIAVTEAEATHFACNVINVGQNILMAAVGGDLAQRLSRLGYDVTELNLSEFIHGGGSANSAYSAPQ